jgi:AraC family transcriptional regulator
MKTAPSTSKPESSLLSRHQAAWEGIKIEHYRFCGGEMPEHKHRQHIMIMPVGVGCNGELRTASGLRLRGRQRNTGTCLIPAGLAHRGQFEGVSEHLSIHLDPSLVTHAADAALLPGNVEVIEKYSEVDSVISSVGMALLAELESEGLSGRLYAESLANVLAVQVLRNYTAASIAPRLLTGGLSGQKLRMVTSYMAENYTQDLRLEELARIAGISRFHFAREFKRTTGTSPHQYLIKLRIERAKALLTESKMPLVEVGLRSGFSHQSHFTRLFRRFTGATPQSYRLIVQR